VVLVAALFTVCAVPADVLALKFASPGKAAVMVFAPAVVDVREQLPAVTVAVQVWLPSLTVTMSDPVTVPLPGAVTATVKATVYACPTTVAVVRFVVIVVVVLAGLIVCVTADDVLVL
jgi:hypothetical protein